MRSPRRFARRFCVWSVPPYGGFGDFEPTLAAEKLCERDGHRISGETLRRWMIADGLWQPRQRRPARIHQRRPWRPCRGDLVQVDGSPHDWFEDRGPRCTLIMFIDDATGELMALRFAVAPQNPHDAHRPVVHTPRELALVLCLHHARILSKNLTLQFQNREYQIQHRGAGYSMRNSKVTVREDFDGDVTVLYKGRALPYRVLAEGEPPIPLDDEKSVHATIQQAREAQLNRPAYKPPLDHPWKRRSYLAMQDRRAAEKGTF